MATFLAITTTNAQINGWTVKAYGKNAQKVEEKARELIGDPGAGGGVRDIYAETEQKNLRVVSKTTAKKYGINFDDAESWIMNYSDAIKVN